MKRLIWKHCLQVCCCTHLTGENVESVTRRQQLCPHHPQEQGRTETKQSYARQQEGPLVWPEAGNRMNLSAGFSADQGSRRDKSSFTKSGSFLKTDLGNSSPFLSRNENHLPLLLFPRQHLSRLQCFP